MTTSVQGDGSCYASGGRRATRLRMSNGQPAMSGSLPVPR